MRPRSTADSITWNTAERKHSDEALQSHLNTPSGVLAMYRAYNAPGHASHKGYLEAYLDQMHDVRVVSANQMLGAE